MKKNKANEIATNDAVRVLGTISANEWGVTTPIGSFPKDHCAWDIKWRETVVKPSLFPLTRFRWFWLGGGLLVCLFLLGPISAVVWVLGFFAWEAIRVAFTKEKRLAVADITLKADTQTYTMSVQAATPQWAAYINDWMQHRLTELGGGSP